MRKYGRYFKIVQSETPNISQLFPVSMFNFDKGFSFGVASVGIVMAYFFYTMIIWHIKKSSFSNHHLEIIQFSVQLIITILDKCTKCTHAEM